MIRPMRRINQALTSEQSQMILDQGSYGVLACLGDDDYPYAVPLNYVYFEGKLYMHSAKEGHKLASISKHNKVSFTVVGNDTVVSEKYTTVFTSVIAFGRASLATGEEHKKAFLALNDKYCADRPDKERMEAALNCNRAVIIAIEIEHLTGKQAKELIGALPGSDKS